MYCLLTPTCTIIKEIYIYLHSSVYFSYIKNYFLFSVCEQIDTNCPKCRETPSQSRFVHNISVPPKCTVPKSGWIPWNDRIKSGKEVQINYRVVVTKYFELVLRGSIETKSVNQGKQQTKKWHIKFT